MADFTARINALLDTRQFQSQINSIQNGTYRINIQANIPNVNNFTNNIRNQMQNAGNAAGGAFSNALNNSIHLRNGNIGNIRNLLQSFGLDRSAINAATRDLDNMVVTVDKLRTRTGRNGNIRMTITGVDEMNRAVNVVREFNAGTGRAVTTSRTFTQTFNNSAQAARQMAADIRNATTAINTGAIGRDISNVTMQFEKLRSTGHTGLTNVTNDLQRLEILSRQMHTATGNDLARNYNEFNNVLARTRNSLSQISAENKTLASGFQIGTLSNKISTWAINNSKAMSLFGADVQRLQNNLATLGSSGTATTGQLKVLENELKRIDLAATQAGVKGKTFGDIMKSSFTTVTRYISASTIVFQAMRAIREMANNVYEVDKAMTELYRITDLTEGGYRNLYADMTKSAKEYGASLSEIVNTTANWVRLGFDTGTANQLAEITAMYQHVTDLDEETATRNLVTAYKGFEKQLLDMNDGDVVSSVRMVADIYDKLGNEFAESAANVGAGLSKSASVLAQAGASIEESAGMFTGIQEVIQDEASAGSALKIYALRIRSMKGELEELGEEVNSNVDSLSKMQTQILNITHGKVNIFDDEGNFRNIFEITRDIANIYDTLSDTEQASLLENIAGKNRANAVQAMIQNWDNVEKATKAAYESSGTAVEEQEKWNQSLEASLKRLDAIWQVFSNDFMNSSFLSGSVNALGGILELLDNIAKSLGTLGTIGAGVGLFAAFKNFGNIKSFAQTLAWAGSSINDFKATLSFGADGFKSFIKTPLGIASAVGVASSVIGLFTQAIKNHEVEQSKLRSEIIETNKNVLDEADSFEKSYIEYNKYAGKNNLTSNEEDKFKTAVDEVSTALSLKAEMLGTTQKAQEDYNKAVAKGTKEELENALISARQSSQAANEQLVDDATNMWGFSNISVNLGGENDVTGELKETRNIIKDMMGDFASFGGLNGVSLILNPKDLNDADSLIEYYYKLKETSDKLAKDDLMNNGYYKDIQNALKGLASAETAVTQEYQKLKIEYETQNGIPKTTAEYKEMRDAIVETASATGNYKTALEDLADEDFKDVFDLSQLNDNSQDITKENVDKFGKSLSSSWKKIPKDVKEAYNDYQNVLKEVSEKSIDIGEFIFGNINLNDRAVIKWSKKNIESYKAVLEEYAKEDYLTNIFQEQGKNAYESFLNSGKDVPKDYIENYVKSFEDTVSTVFGGSESFSIDGKQVEIAFSPILQKENGKGEFLSPSVVRNYINSIIEKATSDGKWSNEELLKLDSEGLEINGKTIKGLLADIGDTAIETSEKMHYLGTDGAYNIALKELHENLDKARISEEDFYKAVSQKDIKKWFDGLSETDKEIAYRISIQTDSTDIWTLEEWRQELDRVKTTGKTTAEQLNELYQVLGSDKDESFSVGIQNYLSQLDTLKDSLSKLNSGSLSGSDMLKLFQQFPTLAKYTDNLGEGIRQMMSDIIGNSEKATGMIGAFDEQISILGKNTSGAKALKELREEMLRLYDASEDGFTFSIDAEIGNIENVYAAIKESVSSTGLSDKSINSIKAMYSGLESYDYSTLFEKTTNGIHLNVQAMRELEHEYESGKKTDLRNELQSLANDYNSLTREINDCDSASKKAEFYQQRNDILTQIEDVSVLITQYDGLTSAFHMWEKAQESPDEDSMFSTLSSGLEKINELFTSGRVGVDDFREAVQLMTDEDVSTASTEELVGIYENGYTSMQRFFTGNKDGLIDFLNTAKGVSDELGKEWVKLDGNGNWSFDIGVGADSELAKAISDMTSLQVSTEEVQILFRALSAYGFDINLDSVNTSLELLVSEAETANEKLINLGKTDIKFDFNTSDVSDAKEQIKEAQSLFNKLKQNESANLKVDGLEEAENVLITLLARKQQLDAPSIMNIDTSQATSDIENAIIVLQNFQRDYNNLEIETAIGADTTEAQSKIQSIVGTIEDLDKNAQIQLGLDNEKFQSAIDSIKNTDIKAGIGLNQEDIEIVEKTISAITPEMIVKAGVDDKKVKEYNADDKEGKVNYVVNDRAVMAYLPPEKIGSVKYEPKLNNWVVPTLTGTILITPKKGVGEVNGTAFANGNWGTRESGTALVGELGTELIVNPRTGTWQTIGDNGAEFINYPKNSIIFNHKQTEELFRNGKVTSYGGRGKMFASGTAFSNGSGNFNVGNVTGSTVTNPTTTQEEDRTEKKKKTTALEKFQKWFSKWFDWIEIKLERQSDKIEKYTKRAENYTDKGNYKGASSNYRKAINSTAEMAKLQSEAARKYDSHSEKVLEKAVKLKLVSRNTADDIAEKVKNGSMDITKYSSKVQEVIKDYQTWYEKSKEAKESVEELTQSVYEYVKSLKDVRDAQRDAKIDRASTYETIGNSSITFTSTEKNNQLSYSNATLSKENKAYRTEIKGIKNDNKKIRKSSLSAVNRKINSKGKSAYQKALKSASKSIKARKPVSKSDLKIIKANSIDIYEKVYAYNLSLDNLENAKLENALTFAQNNAKIYQNISEKYTNKNNEINDNINLTSRKIDNANTVRKKNNYLNSQRNSYNSIIVNDNKAIVRFSKNVKNARKKINKKAIDTNFKNASSKTQKIVTKLISSVRKTTKSGKAISSSTLSKIAKYNSEGYINDTFYYSCIRYNNALASKEQAKSQKNIDLQTYKSEKVSVGTEKVDNVKKSYENKLNTNSANTNKIKISQDLKTAKGLSLTSKDYENLISQSKKEQKIYNDEAIALKEQIDSNVKSGLWTKSSQAYKDAITDLEDIENKSAECAIQQEEWNNAIVALPFSKLEKALDLLDSIKSKYESELEIRKAKGISESEDEYLKEIKNINNEINKNVELRSEANKNYKLAKKSGVYGGKTADEWLIEYNKYSTTINRLKADVEELNNSIANIPYEEVKKAIDLLNSKKGYYESYVSLLSATRQDLIETDYINQINYNKKIIDKLSSERQQAYNDYLLAQGNKDKVYGGKTDNEWLAMYNDLGADINKILADNEELKKSLRDDVYWRTFERAHESAKRFQNVLSGLSDLIDESMYFDKDNSLTSFGISQMANLISSYETARDEVSNYQNDIKNLNSLYSDGYYTQNEYVEKLNELQDGLLGAASSMKRFSNSIADMYKDMAKAELDSLFELIDARNQALSSKKSYYEYDRTIKSKTKDIQSLESQIAALNGIDSAQARAKRASLEEQLSDVRQELEDTVNDHIFDLSQNALDELKTTLQDAFDDKWDNLNSNLEEISILMASANTLTSNSTNTIVRTMNKLLEYYGINPITSGIDKAYATGTRNVPRNLMALTNEKGNEILVTKEGLIAPMKQGEGVIPSYLTDRLYDLAINGIPTPNIAIPTIAMPQIEIPTTAINQHYDSLINIEGSADAATVEDLKNMSKDILEKSYTYTSQKIYKGFIHSGGKRNI